MIVTHVGQLIVLRVLREQQEPRGRLDRQEAAVVEPVRRDRLDPLEVEEVLQGQLVSVGLRV